MFESIAGKRVLVTGASSGIGEAIARIFADYGARVGLHYFQSKTKALALAQDLRQKGITVALFRADLITPKGRSTLIKKFAEHFGGIDVLINNAGGVPEYKHFLDLNEREWGRAFELQTKAPFVLSRDAFVLMKKQGGGRIINISTVAVKYAGSKSLHYTASKAALETLTRGLSREGAAHNVLANVIRCGLVDTPMRKKLANYSEVAFQKRLSLVPLGRAGRPIDIAQMALFLASEAGDFITGECLSVAGGD